MGYGWKKYKVQDSECASLKGTPAQPNRSGTLSTSEKKELVNALFVSLYARAAGSLA